MRTYFLRKPQLYLFRILQECLIYIQTAESCIYHTNIKKKQQRLLIVVPKEGPILFPCECHQLHLAECYFVYGDCQYSAQFIQLLELSKSQGIFSMIIDLKICGVSIILGYKLPLLIQHDIFTKNTDIITTLLSGCSCLPWPLRLRMLIVCLRLSQYYS